jgi:hypothetical protein
MCLNCGWNWHPGRPPCALQWWWYSLFVTLRNKFFPKRLEVSPTYKRPSILSADRSLGVRSGK